MKGKYKLTEDVKIEQKKASQNERLLNYIKSGGKISSYRPFYLLMLVKLR